MNAKFKRVLLKLSGEALSGSKGFGLDESLMTQVAKEVAEIQKADVQIGIVIGGGNFLRGGTTTGIPRVSADSMGMLATVINSIAFSEHLNQLGCPARVLTAVHLDRAGEFFTRERALEYLEKGTTVLFAGGTGNPFFTTDTAAALRCAEIDAEVILKATKVDGVYDSDPFKNSDAKRFNRIDYSEALSRNLKVMDATAFSFCMERNIPIIVFKLLEPGNLRKCVEGLPIGTTVRTGG